MAKNTRLDKGEEKSKEIKKKKDGRGQHTGKGKHELWKYSPTSNPYKELKEMSDAERRELVSHTLAEILKWYNMPKVKTDEELEERIIFFFETCIKTGEMPTWEKLALACGVHRGTLWEWESGGKGSTPRRADFLKKAKEFMASYDAEIVANNKMPPVAYIFRAKNYYGMKDQVEYNITPKQQIDDVAPVEEIAKRIEGAVVIEDIREDKHEDEDSKDD